MELALSWQTIVMGMLHLVVSVVMLFMHGGIIAWALYKLNPSHNYRGQAGITRLIWYVFEAHLLTMLFLSLSFAAVAFGLSRVQCIPFVQATSLIGIRHFWEPLYFLVTTALQIIFIKIPEHVSKRDFVLAIAAINLGVTLVTMLAHVVVDKVVALF